MSGYSLVVLSPKYPPDSGGASTYFELITDYIGEKGIPESITIVTTNRIGSPTIKKHGDKTIIRIMPNTTNTNPVARLLGFILKQFVLFSVFGYYSLNRSWTVFHVHSTLMYMGRERFNIVLATWITILKRICNSIYILDIRDKYTIPEKLRSFDAIITASLNIREAISSTRIDIDRVVTLPVPIDLNRIRNHSVDASLNSKLPADYVCYVGDISTRKGATILVETAKTLREEIEFVLVGEPVDKAGQDTLKTLPNNITYMGQLTHEKALQIIDGASALILPSESEGMPRVILEAIALETPVAVSASIPEFEDDKTILKLDNRSEETIAEMLLDSQWITSTYSIENHDIHRVGPELLIFYKRLLEEKD